MEVKTDKAKREQITPAMVDAGVRVLRESGLLYRESSADPVVVRLMLETVLGFSPARNIRKGAE